MNLQETELINFALAVTLETRYRIGATRARVSDLWFEFQRSKHFTATKNQTARFYELAAFLKERQ